MEPLPNFKRRFEKVMRMAGERGFALCALWVLLHFLSKIRIHLGLFYYLEEVPSTKSLSAPDALPEGYEFSAFGLNDVLEIGRIAERKDYADARYALDCYNRGEICLGIKQKKEIVAFMWVSLNQCNSTYHYAQLRPNEAYFHDLYVIESHRNKNIASILRLYCYDTLQKMRCNTYYSITDLFNTPSVKFHLKMGARIVFLGLRVELFGKSSKNYVLRRC